jgi:hypothetical protein
MMATPAQVREYYNSIYRQGGPDEAYQYLVDNGIDPAQLGIHASAPSGGVPEVSPTNRYLGTEDMDALAAYRRTVEQKTGMPVDWEGGLGFGDRALGATAEDQEEEIASFKYRYPDGRVAKVKNDYTGEVELFFQLPGSDKLVPRNKKGMDVGDLGAAVPEGIKGALAALTAINPGARGASLLSRSGILPEAIRGGMGYAAGQAAEEGLESSLGIQKETPGEIIGTVAKGAAMETGFGALGGLGTKFAMNPAMRRHTTDMPAVLKEELQDIQKLYDLDAAATAIPKYAIDPSMIYTRLISNLDRISGTLSANKREVLRQIADEMNPGGDFTIEGRKLLEKLEPGLQEEILAGTGISAVDPKLGGKAAKFGMGAYTASRRAKAGQAYNDLQTIVAEENPVFDFTGPKASIAQAPRVTATETLEVPTGLVDARGHDLTQLVTNYMDVTGSPGTVYDRAANLLDRMDTFQNQYEVAKELRTQVNKAIRGQSDKFGNVPPESLPLIDLRNALTDTLETPVNAEVTPRYNEGIKAAGEGWRTMLKETQTANTFRFLKEEDPMTLVTDLLQGRGAPDEVMGAMNYLQEFHPKRAAQYKDAFKTQVTMNQGTNNASQVMELRKNNPDLYEYVGGDRLLEQARQSDEIWASPGGQAIINRANPAGEYRGLIPAIKSPTEARQLIRQVGGEGSEGHQLLQLAIAEDLVSKAKIKADPDSSRMVFDSNSFHKALADYRDSGVYDMLSSEQQTRVKGIAARLRVMNRQLLSDSGAALEGQKLVTDVKDPRKTIFALAEMEWNYILSSAVLAGDGLKKLDKVISRKSPIPTRYGVALMDLVGPVYGTFEDAPGPSEVPGELYQLGKEAIEWGTDWKARQDREFQRSQP